MIEEVYTVQSQIEQALTHRQKFSKDLDLSLERIYEDQTLVHRSAVAYAYIFEQHIYRF